MILLWGLEVDPPLAAVKDALEILRAPYLFLDQDKVSDTRINLRIGKILDGVIECPAMRIPLSNITAFYLRPHDVRHLPTVGQAGEDGRRWEHALQTDEVLLAWADITDALVINRPSAAASNNSKPYQAMLIESLGFATPDTLITTDPEAAHQFLLHHGSVVYKSISGVRSIVARFRDADQSRLADVRWCPTQFQEFIKGQDFRVHVIGNDVFACEMISEADDYRYAARSGLSVEIRRAVLPTDIINRCRTLAAGLRLPVVGIDLRRTAEGRWYCFEVNPSPGFSYYEQATDQPLAFSIARLLLQGPSGRQSSLC